MAHVFYNENEPYAAEWLRRLASKRRIAPGNVDDRSIVKLKPEDLQGYRQAHFFAGLGVWSYALRLAGWPDDLECWTGSCPCQPWSQAGHGRGFDDERHIWPAWFKLIEECRPPVVFGEQVASPDGLKWFDSVHADLEGAGYAVGAADLCAAGVGAPHLRQRLFFVAVSGEQRRPLVGEARVHGRRQTASGDGAAAQDADGARRHDDAGRGAPHDLAHSRREGREQVSALGEGRSSRSGAARVEQRSEHGGRVDVGGALGLGDARSQGGGRDAGAVPRTEAQGRREGVEPRREPDQSVASGAARKLGDASGEGSPLGQRPEERFGAVRLEGPSPAETGATRGFWRDAEWWLCRDGKARPAQPGSFPLVDGAPARVGRLRAYGNAIVAPVAATFIRAAREAITKGRNSDG